MRVLKAGLNGVAQQAALAVGGTSRLVVSCGVSFKGGYWLLISQSPFVLSQMILLRKRSLLKVILTQLFKQPS